MSRSDRYTHNHYLVGIICALAEEKAAFVAMLDEEHEPLPTPKGDNNSYTFGRIGEHNIVTACLPAGATGNNPAVMVANDMLRTFPIKIGLLVGVGGGVWSKQNDIRLGDVVVSQPKGALGGVVQWDYGKMETGSFRRKGSLDKPPKPLLNAVQNLKTAHLLDGDRIATHLAQMLRNKPNMAQKFKHPGTEHDRLYESTDVHLGDETCNDFCGQMIERPPREKLDPQIHYGNIASGNGVMMDGKVRDLIARELDVICFEMEAAGLMDNFPCLVIRGICDYADSHKNKQWQPYAAAAAAAVTVELLRFVPKQAVEGLEPAKMSRYATPFSLKGVPRVRQFVDRPAEMAQIEHVLLPVLEQRQEQSCRQKVHVLRGLGGMGKTQLAVEFARRHHQRFSAVFWLDGRSKDTVKRSIASCADRIPHGQISANDREDDDDAAVKGVMGWLARSDNTDWLLIFDNVDQEYGPQGSNPNAYDVKQYFPDADHGSVLITTRLARLEQLEQQGKPQQLSRVDDDQARTIFESWYTKKHNNEESRRLLELLGGLPLAIAQAGAYLQESGVGLAAYLRFYEQQWSELMKSEDVGDAPLQEYPDRSVWTTWAISYQAIRDKHEPTANLLLLWSFLANKDLWYGLFAEAYRSSPVAARMIGEWIGDVASSELAFSRAMQRLRSYSLIEEVEEMTSYTSDPEEGTTSYTTHPVVHQWARHSQGKQFEAKLRRLAEVLVGWAVPYYQNSWVIHHRLLPHAQAASRGVTISQRDQNMGRDEKYEKANERDDEREAVQGAIYGLGDLYFTQGKLDEAEQMFERALRGYTEVLGAKHISTLNTARSLGSIYHSQGRLDEAEQIFERALRGYTEVLGVKKIGALVTIEHLVKVYCSQGKLAKAEQVHTQALQRYEGSVDLEDRVLALRTVSRIGHFYSTQGKLGKAEEMWNRALQGYEEGLGPNHIYTINRVYDLGRLYHRQDRLEEAQQMYVRAVRGYKETLGPNDPETRSTVNNLGLLYWCLGKLDAAEELYNRALQGYKETPEPQHTSKVLTITNLGFIYCAQGRLEEAEQVLKQALQEYKDALGPNKNAFTLLTVSGLGIVYYDQDRLDEAEEMYERAMRGYKQALGDDGILRDLDALKTMANMGDLYAKQQQYAKAQAMYAKVLPSYQAQFGQDNSRTKDLMAKMRALQVPDGERDEQIRLLDVYCTEVSDSQHVKEESKLGILERIKTIFSP